MSVLLISLLLRLTLVVLCINLNSYVDHCFAKMFSRYRHDKRSILVFGSEVAFLNLFLHAGWLCHLTFPLSVPLFLFHPPFSVLPSFPPSSPSSSSLSPSFHSQFLPSLPLLSLFSLPPQVCELSREALLALTSPHHNPHWMREELRISGALDHLANMGKVVGTTKPSAMLAYCVP